MSDLYKNFVKSLCELENLIDIAPLGKATQSSTSQWSKPDDAKRAVTDMGGVNFAFHTDKEQNPWWELTLDKPRPIEYIILHNRKDMFQEKARKLKIEVYNGKEYLKIYEGDLLFDAEPNGLPLILPYKYPQTIERIKITSQINEYFHLSKVNVLVVKKIEKKKPKIKVGIIGTSNSVMKEGYIVGLQNNPDVVIQKNASMGGSHATLVPYAFSKHDFSGCDVILLDILVNEQFIIFGYDYNIPLSLQIFDYFLTACAALHVLPIMLLMPEAMGYNSPQNPKFQQIRRHYMEICSKQNIPYFDGYAYAENTWGKKYFVRLFQDRAHLSPIYAQEMGSALAKSILTIYNSHKIINEDLNIYDFKYIGVINSGTENKNIIERKTSLTENRFLKLSLDETCDIQIGEYEIVGISFNKAQSNGILEFKGENLYHKMTLTPTFHPNRLFTMSVWSLLKPIKADAGGKIRLKCLALADIPNIELHDEGRNFEQYSSSNEPVRIEIEGLMLRSKEMHTSVGMKIGINLDLQIY
ncbi:MAG: discoidin domain-containing protein [Campylobacteraceae bacterium]|jgi:hypothetical protein|nr:discoidin domain-containing protein [Campylobacteraceae bacterium]